MAPTVIVDICDTANTAAKMKGFRKESGLFSSVTDVGPNNRVVGVTCNEQKSGKMPSQSPGAKWHKEPGKWLVVSIPKT